jgi:hypothetical protein
MGKLKNCLSSTFVALNKNKHTEKNRNVDILVRIIKVPKLKIKNIASKTTRQIRNSNILLKKLKTKKNKIPVLESNPIVDITEPSLLIDNTPYYERTCKNISDFNNAILKSKIINICELYKSKDVVKAMVNSLKCANNVRNKLEMSNYKHSFISHLNIFYDKCNPSSYISKELLSTISMSCINDIPFSNNCPSLTDISKLHSDFLKKISQLIIDNNNIILQIKNT